MSELAINALVRLRAQIAGEIEHHQSEAERCARKMEHVDAVLHIMAPDLKLEDVKAKAFPPRTSKRQNSNTRILATVLRERGVPMLVTELTDELITRRKLQHLDDKAMFNLRHGVENAMNRLRRRGEARSILQDVGPQRWALVD